MLNVKDTAHTACVGEQPGMFGGFGAIKYDGLAPDDISSKRFLANPPYDSAAARATGATDYITNILNNTTMAARAVLWIPSRIGHSYETLVGTKGGEMFHIFAPRTVCFTPMSHWRGG